MLGNGEIAMHYAFLVSNLTRDLTILTNGHPDFSPEQMTRLKHHNIDIVESEIAEIEHKKGHIQTIVFKNGKRMHADALYFRPPFKQHSDIPALLGCEVDEHGYIKVDARQRTTVDGVFACGDNSSMMRSVAMGVATGNMAGAAVNGDLAAERF